MPTGVKVTVNGLSVGTGQGAIDKAFDKFLGRKVLTSTMREVLSNSGKRSFLSKTFRKELEEALLSVRDNIAARYYNANHTIWEVNSEGYPVKQRGKGAHQGPSPWSNRGNDLHTVLKNLEVLITREKNTGNDIAIAGELNLESLERETLNRSGFWPNTSSFEYWLAQEFGGTIWGHTFSGKHFFLGADGNLHPSDREIFNKLRDKIKTIIRSRLK